MLNLVAQLLPYRDWIGYLAGTLVTVAFIPQVLKTLKEGNTDGISLGMYVLYCGGVGLWLLYGLIESAWPIILSNFVTLILAGSVLVLKIKDSLQR
jgi:MtN3 and saliva related transmembrane protein